MLWAALLLDTMPSAAGSSPTDADAEGSSTAGPADRQAVAAWCLQFTPRVALAEADGVVMELLASERLFGGRRRLVERVRDEASGLGVGRLGWAPTGLAAIAFARSGVGWGFGRPLTELLDGLPLQALAATAAHRPTLERLGCRTLGQLRALPRGGIARRFDKELLAALDRACGLRPEAWDWVVPTETFRARCELALRVEAAPVLLFAARRLLLALCGWLAARQAGVRAFELRWRHDAMRTASTGEGGELTLRTVAPTRDVEHLARLLAEHLARLRLAAPVGALELVAVDVAPLQPASASLLPDAGEPRGEALALVVERIAARLGPRRLLRPVLADDHRPEWMVHWQPALSGRPGGAYRDSVPQPTFLLAEPLRLATRGPRPLYQGPLQLLAGPHRVEGGWWHRVADAGGEVGMRNVARDYWLAASEHAGLLWIFQTRLADDETGWFLHGCFA